MVENQPDPLVSHQQLNNTLGYSLTAEEYQHCLNEVEFSTPKVGNSCQGTEAERGIYIVIAGKVRLLDEAGELITSLEARSSFGHFSLVPGS
jgi:ATP-binding cassette subfamily B protein